MKRIACIFAVLCLGLVVGTLGTQADTHNKKTQIQFNEPVEVPGATLPAGTYVFRLMDSRSDRHIVQVTNVAGNHVFATILTISDYRRSPTSHTVMTFGESEACGPVTLKSWFFPGDKYGQRFVYPKDRAAEIASNCKEPVPQVAQTLPAEAPPAAESVTVTEVTPEKQEVPYNPAPLAENDVKDTKGFDAEELPKTASDAPLFAGLGLLMLAGAFLARYSWKRSA
ncbi:MAG: LPXTG cell wall anchor domain-containing protein [Candidatus Acidiferrales bacterium]